MQIATDFELFAGKWLFEMSLTEEIGIRLLFIESGGF